jgi:hypothetical protein
VSSSIRWLCAAALFVAGPAHAAWYVAKSKHFVIYADQNPNTLSRFASHLEMFDRAVRHERNMADPEIGDGNRLTVFVMPTAASVQKLYGDKTGFIDGFYKGPASGPLAYVTREDSNDETGDFANIVFFHEYAHHLMFQAIDRPLPEWFVEGFAEFMSTVRFERNGTVGLGAPANHRAWSLLEGPKLPLETLLTASSSSLPKDQRESFYARSWLLTHYLTFEKSRAGQLQRYADLFANGTPSLDAARSAFGDLRKLDHDLAAYLERSKMTYLQVNGAGLQPGPIDIQPLSEAASKVILLRATLKNGVGADAEALAAQIRAVQASYPNDQLVEATLAEAELDVDRPEAAEAAADRAIKADPRSTEPLVLKGKALEARAEKVQGDASEALFGQARTTFIAANKIDTEDPEPLMEFYKTFHREGIRPTPNAIAALHYASDLAPQDLGLRMNSAMQYLIEGKLAEARSAIVPIAYDPHGEEIATVARQMLGKIDAGDSKGALEAASGAPRESSSAR